MRAGFPDIVFSIQEQITEDDKVASRLVLTRVSSWVFPQQTGLCASRALLSIALRMGVLKDTRIIMDTFGLITQLGALPSSPTP
jgi:hypothetical protein